MSIGRVALLALALSLPLSGCGVYWNAHGPEVDAYELPALEDHEVAVIDHGLGCFDCVQRIISNDTGAVVFIADATDADPYIWGVNRIRLMPGSYNITLKYRAYKSNTRVHTSSATLIAGQTYYVRRASCLGIVALLSSCSEGTSYVWMEDGTTGEVIIGIKK